MIISRRVGLGFYSNVFLCLSCMSTMSLQSLFMQIRENKRIAILFIIHAACPCIRCVLLRTCSKYFGPGIVHSIRRSALLRSGLYRSFLHPRGRLLDYLPGSSHESHLSPPLSSLRSCILRTLQRPSLLEHHKAETRPCRGHLSLACPLLPLSFQNTTARGSEVLISLLRAL